MGLAQNTVTDAQMCQKCDGMVRYHYRQYGQLGDYFCDHATSRAPDVGLRRPHRHRPAGVTMEVVGLPAANRCIRRSRRPTPPTILWPLMPFAARWAFPRPISSGPKMPSTRATAACSGYRLGGRDVLLNLAKNPTGFNQNLKIVEADRGPKMVAFSINDQVADGRDISWIWDIDFEELAGQPDTVVFAGGSVPTWRCA